MDKLIIVLFIGFVVGVIIAALVTDKHERKPDDDVVTVDDSAYPYRVRILTDHGVLYRVITYDRSLVILPPLPQKVEKP